MRTSYECLEVTMLPSGSTVPTLITGVLFTALILNDVTVERRELMDNFDVAVERNKLKLMQHNNSS